MTEARRPKGPPVRLRQDGEPESVMPARPQIDTTPPPPVERGIARRPRTLVLSVLLWQLSFLAGLAGAVLLLARRDEAKAELSLRIIERRPETAADDAVTLADRVVLLSAVLGVVLIITCAGLVLGVWQRRRVARAVLLLAGVATIGFDLVQYEVLPGQGRTATDPRVAVLAQGALVLLAMLMLMARPARRWMRRR